MDVKKIANRLFWSGIRAFLTSLHFFPAKLSKTNYGLKHFLTLLYLLLQNKVNSIDKVIYFCLFIILLWSKK